MTRNLILVTLACLWLGACSGGKVERMDTAKVVDLQGEWNDTDSRLVAEEMIKDSLERPWANEFFAANKRKPVVRLRPDDVRVKTNGDVISKNIFLNDIRRAFVNSSRVTVVSTNDESSITRSDMAENNAHSRAETRKEERQETMADFLLHGEINVQDQVDGSKQLKFYSVDLILTSVQTREQVWIGNKKLKKLVTNGKTR